MKETLNGLVEKKKRRSSFTNKCDKIEKISLLGKVEIFISKTKEIMFLYHTQKTRLKHKILYKTLKHDKT